MHRNARILAIEPDRVRAEVDRGRVVIVAGFQGVTEEMDVATIGRGGSDTTAVAFAAALEARCEIYTDVDGVYTADPRIVPDARKLQDISYEEMLELASKGAKVMAPRAVELGCVYGIPILVASSFSDEPGTLIHGGVDMEGFNRVRGIAHDLDVAKITIRHVPDRPGVAAEIFEPLAEAHLSVDTIVQNASELQLTDITFTLGEERPGAGAAVRATTIAQKIGAEEVVADEKMGKVSIVGTGIQSAPGLRGADVPGAVGGGDQHRDHQHERDQDHVHHPGGQRVGCGAGAAQGVRAGEGGGAVAIRANPHISEMAHMGMLTRNASGPMHGRVRTVNYRQGKPLAASNLARPSDAISVDLIWSAGSLSMYVIATNELPHRTRYASECVELRVSE